MARPPILSDDPEVLIGIGRLLSSTFALAAVYLDPTQPENLVNAAYWILAGYVAVSVLFLFIIPRKGFTRSYQAVTTGWDIGTIGILVYITGELESPFFTFYAFVLLSAALRWRWAGILTVAVALQTILALVGASDLRDGKSELNFLIMRSVFCWVMVLLLGYFANFRSRSQQRLRELAAWPHEIIAEGDRPWLSASLSHASRVLGARTIIVIWQDRDQETQHAAVWTDMKCTFLDKLRLPELAADISAPPDGNQLASAVRDAFRASRSNALGIAPLRWREVFMSPISTIRFRGNVLVLDPAYRNHDIDLLTRIVGARIAIDLEQFFLTQSFASAASLRERVRLAHDLHDSILQDLTAAVIQIDAAERSSPEAAPSIRRFKDLLQNIQRSIRGLVSDAREQPTLGRPLADQLEMFVAPLAEQWQCRVGLAVRPPELAVSASLATELCLVLSEATANAARHGAANAIDVAVTAEAEHLRVMIVDNGDGGGTDGVPYPASIGARITDLGGRLRVERGLSGLTLEISLPMVAAAL